MVNCPRIKAGIAGLQEQTQVNPGWVKSKQLNYLSAEGAALQSRKVQDVPRSLSVIPASGVIELSCVFFWVYSSTSPPSSGRNREVKKMSKT